MRQSAFKMIPTLNDGDIKEEVGDELEMNGFEDSETEELSSSEDEESSSEEETEEEDEPGEAQIWPKEDLLELLRRIHHTCMSYLIAKKEDVLELLKHIYGICTSNLITMKKDSVLLADHLKASWDEIKFSNYTADQCRERWNHFLSRLKSSPSLDTFLNEAKSFKLILLLMNSDE